MHNPPRYPRCIILLMCVLLYSGIKLSVLFLCVYESLFVFLLVNVDLAILNMIVERSSEVELMRNQ